MDNAIIKLSSVNRRKVGVSLVFKVAVNSPQFSGVAIHETLDGKESLNTIDDLLTLCFRILSKEDAWYRKAQEKGLDKAVGLGFLPDVATLELAVFDVARRTVIGGLEPLVEGVYRVVGAVKAERVPLDARDVIVKVALNASSSMWSSVWKSALVGGWVVLDILRTSAGG